MVLLGRMRLHRMLFGLFGYSLLLVGAHGVSRESFVCWIFVVGFGFFVRCDLAVVHSWRYNISLNRDWPYRGHFGILLLNYLLWLCLVSLETAIPLALRYKVLLVLGTFRAIVTKVLVGFLFVKGLAKSQDVIFSAR